MDAHNTDVPRDIVVVAGSQGATQALRIMLAQLPADFPAAILIVIHTSPSSPGYLASVLNRYSNLPVEYAEHEQPVLPGHVYLASADLHLEVMAPGIIRLSDGPKVNFARPAADQLFMSAAEVYGSRVISLVLSGGDSDGSVGAVAVLNAGGLSFVQRPEEAAVPSMPIQAMQKVPSSVIVGVAELAATLSTAVGRIRR